MANRGYDVVVDVDAEVRSPKSTISLGTPLTHDRVISATPTYKRTLNSTHQVQPTTPSHILPPSDRELQTSKPLPQLAANYLQATPRFCPPPPTTAAPTLP
jgi:hypothetical protein